MESKVLHGTGKPTIILKESSIQFLGINHVKSGELTYTLNTTDTLTDDLLNRAFMVAISYGDNINDMDKWEITYGRITSFNNTTKEITVAGWRGRTPEAGNTLYKWVDGKVIDLPYCGALIETFTPDALEPKKLFSGQIINKILGYYYSASLDYSGYTDASVLSKLDAIFDSGRVEAFTFYPRRDNTLVKYNCELDVESSLTWQQHVKHQGYKYVAVNIKAVKRIPKINLTSINDLPEITEPEGDYSGYGNKITQAMIDYWNAKENPLSFNAPLTRTGQQISFSYIASNLKITSGALNTIQDIHTGASVQFGSADLVDSLNMSGELLSDSARNVYAARIGVGGDPDFTNYIFKAYGSGHFTGNILVDGDIYIGGRINQVNVNDLYVVDKNIILNRGGDNTTAVNAGIKVEGASAAILASLLFDGTNWTHSHDINTASGKGYKVNNSFAIDASRNFFGANATLSGKVAIGGAALTEALNVTGNTLLSGYIAHPSYASQTSRWRISSLGEADFRYIYADELHTKAFIADLEQALAGGQIIGKSVAKIAADFTLPAAGGQVVIEVESFAGFPSSYVFQNNDWLEIKKFDRPVTANTIGLDIGIAYGRVAFVEFVSGSNPATQRWTFTRDTAQPGTATGIVKAGTLALDKGIGGNGYIESNAIDGQNGINSPYIQTAYWIDHPANKFVGARLGNMRGIAGNPWGELSVHGLYADVAWLTDNVVIGGRSLGLMQGITALFHFDDNLRDSISGINASYTGTLNETAFGLVTSSDNSLVYTKVNGKFGGGVAIEEATTNLITNGGFETGNTNGYSWWGSGTRSITQGYHGNGYYMESTSSAVGLSSSAIAAVSGTTYTIQVKAKGDHLNYFYILKASGNINISALATKTYLEGGWYQLTYTVTCSVTETWNILFAFYNNAKGVIDEAQVEAKPFATSFVESSRVVGALKYSANLLNPSEWSIGFWASIDFNKMRSWSDLIDIAVDNNDSFRLERNNLNNYFTVYHVSAGTTLWSKTGASLTAGNHYFTITFSGTYYRIYVDGVLYIEQASTAKITTAGNIWLGSRNSSQISANTVIDDLAIFSRVLSENDIKRIYYSGQPLQESPGMTYINGGKVRTGWISSENYVAGVSGSLWNLNTGYLETNDGWFRGTITASSGLIGGWTIAAKYIDSQYQNDTVNGYLARLTTDLNNSGNNRPGLQFNWGWPNPPSRPSGDISNSLRNSITIGAASYLYTSIGQFAANNWIYDGGGIAINVDARAIFFAGKRGDVVGGAIANWNFNYYKLWNNNVRLESSYNPVNFQGFTGLAINDGVNDRVKIGEFVGTHPDTSIDSTLTYMNDPNFTGSLISYATSGYGSTPGAWATRGTLTWSITNGYLQIYSATSQPAADTWCTFKNASGLNNKTVLIEFELTVDNDGSANWTPYVKLDFFDGDVNGSNGADMRRFSQYYHYVNPGTYTISKFVTFGTGAYKVIQLYSPSGPGFKIVRLDKFTIKEYPDVYTYINGSGLEIYKSPVEKFSFLNGNFNVALNELYINGFLNLNRGLMIGDFKIENEGDRLQFWHKKSNGDFDAIGYIDYNRGNTLL